MKFEDRLRLDESRNRVWYEMIRLECLIYQGIQVARNRQLLTSNLRKYKYLCKKLRLF